MNIIVDMVHDMLSLRYKSARYFICKHDRSVDINFYNFDHPNVKVKVYTNIDSVVMMCFCDCSDMYAETYRFIISIDDFLFDRVLTIVSDIEKLSLHGLCNHCNLKHIDEAVCNDIK